MVREMPNSHERAAATTFKTTNSVKEKLARRNFEKPHTQNRRVGHPVNIRDGIVQKLNR